MKKASGFETIIYEKDGNIATLTLNRPRVRNAYNIQMRDDLYEALGAVRDDLEIQGMILKSAGEVFCSGADLTEFGTAPSQAIARRVRRERDVWGRFLSMHKPTVVALQGFVLGSGVEMALLCDLRIAAEDAVFGMPEIGLGMIPAAGGTQTLPRILGVGPAMDLLLTGRHVDARQALQLGLVHRVVPKDQIFVEAHSMLRRSLGGGAEVVRYAKEALSRGLELPLESGLALEHRLAWRLVQSQREAI